MNDGLFYCLNCRTYLGTAERPKAKTIWETDAQKNTPEPASAIPQPGKSEKWFILCRNCGRKATLKNMQNRPLACVFCGFDYDSLLDAPQKEQPCTPLHKGGGQVSAAHDSTVSSPEPARRVRPMYRKAVPDTSILRLRSLNSPGEFFPSDRQVNVIGTGGSLSPGFFRGFKGIAPTHCVIGHDVSGWFIRFFDKNSQFNGQWVDIGDQVPLNDGDFITLGSNCVLQVFINRIQRG